MKLLHVNIIIYIIFLKHFKIFFHYYLPAFIYIYFLNKYIIEKI